MMRRRNQEGLMRVLYWYCDDFNWDPAIKALDDAGEAEAGRNEKCVVAFIHVEPEDVSEAGSAETKLVKNAKWLARKWETDLIILHSFTHLGEIKAEPEEARSLLDRVEQRIKGAGYRAMQTPYGYFLNLDLKAPGHPLARIYKEF